MVQIFNDFGIQKIGNAVFFIDSNMKLLELSYTYSNENTYNSLETK